MTSWSLSDYGGLSAVGCQLSAVSYRQSGIRYQVSGKRNLLVVLVTKNVIKAYGVGGWATADS